MCPHTHFKLTRVLKVLRNMCLQGVCNPSPAILISKVEGVLDLRTRSCGWRKSTQLFQSSSFSLFRMPFTGVGNSQHVEGAWLCAVDSSCLTYPANAPTLRTLKAFVVQAPVSLIQVFRCCIYIYIYMYIHIYIYVDPTHIDIHIYIYISI